MCKVRKFLQKLPVLCCYAEECLCGYIPIVPNMYLCIIVLLDFLQALCECGH